MSTGTSQARLLVAALRERNLRIATAESCTGGMMASLITSVPGSSEAFDGGIVSYANTVKQRSLGVRAETLEKYGAVSAETAAEMVSGVCRIMDVPVGISVTGIAGPGGGTAEKPVGLVWFGVSYHGIVNTECRRFDGGRAAVRRAASHYAIALALDMIMRQS